MAIKEVIKMGHPTLRLTAKELTQDEVNSKWMKSLLDDMRDTMNHLGGIGIAAPQINESYQVAIIHLPPESDRYEDVEESQEFVIINPKIKVLDEQTQIFWEGCLSVPGLRGKVERPAHIKIDYLDLDYKEQSIELSGFLATVFQHELDHLFGVLYVDKVIENSLMYEEEQQKFHSEDVNT